MTLSILLSCVGLGAGLLLGRVRAMMWSDTLLLASIGVTLAQLAALAFNAQSVSAAELSTLPRLFAAFQSTPTPPLAFVCAFVFGYSYWMFNLLAGDSPAWLSPRLLHLADRSFLLTVGAVVVGLGGWNYALVRIAVQ